MCERIPDDPKDAFRDDPIGDLDEAQDLYADLGIETDSARSLVRDAEAWGAERAFEALSHVATSITGNLDFPSLVKQTLDVALGAIGAPRGAVLLRVRGSDDLVPVAARDVGGGELRDVTQLSNTILRAGVERGEAVVTPNAQTDPRFRDVPSVHLKQIRSVICIPMIVRGDVLGFLYVDHPDRDFFPAHAQRFLTAFAGVAGVAIDNARLHGDLVRENASLKKRLVTTDSFGRLITASRSMSELLHRAEMAARVDMAVMILGESGTGKELVARAVHEAGPRAVRPFVAYNCAAIPRDLMESIFFGHAKGAFTGALRESAGLFEQADGGTLFLDEIADLDLSLQAKLLRVLEDGRVRRIGDATEVSVDVRLITATSRNLDLCVENGEFREDLLYRMNVLELRLPPLRERHGDIPILVDHFVRKHADAEFGEVLFTEEAMAFLDRWPWPGNVRELENVVQRARVLGGQRVLDVPDLERLMTPARGGAAATSALERPQPADAPASPDATLDDRERAAIEDALARAGGNKSKAARFLGIHRNSLARRMVRLGIRWDD